MYTAGHINYGGRVTDDWDRRCMMDILSDYYNDNVLQPEHLYDASGVYKQLDPTTELEVNHWWTLSAANCCKSLLRHTRTHARTHAQPFYGSLDFVRDYPGEPVPER